MYSQYRPYPFFSSHQINLIFNFPVVLNTIIQLGFATLRSGRPDLKSLIWKLLDEANGETGVGVCGPLGLSTAVRTIVATASDTRGVHKGTGAEGIYLHVECFGW